MVSQKHLSVVTSFLFTSLPPSFFLLFFNNSVSLHLCWTMTDDFLYSLRFYLYLLIYVSVYLRHIFMLNNVKVTGKCHDSSL